MSRRIRVDPPGGVHHVMNRGVNRGTVFFDDAARLEFGAQLQAIHERFEAHILAYCLMDNHYHLLLRTEPGTISSAMQQLSSQFTRHTNDRLGRDGPLFRGRFHAIPVTTDGYLLAAFRYIHRNPLDMPGVSSIAAYRWSSYRTYLSLRPTPDFLDPTMLREIIGGRQALAEFHAANGFADLLRCSPDQAAATLRLLIDLAISVDGLAQEGEWMVPPRLDRTIVHLLDTVPSLSPDLIEQLRDPSMNRNARRLARRRAEQRRAHDPTVDRVLALINDYLAPSVGRLESDHNRPPDA